MITKVSIAINVILLGLFAYSWFKKFKKQKLETWLKKQLIPSGAVGTMSAPDRLGSRTAALRAGAVLDGSAQGMANQYKKEFQERADELTRRFEVEKVMES